MCNSFSSWEIWSEKLLTDNPSPNPNTGYIIIRREFSSQIPDALQVGHFRIIFDAKKVDWKINSEFGYFILMLLK